MCRTLKPGAGRRNAPRACVLAIFAGLLAACDGVAPPPSGDVCPLARREIEALQPIEIEGSFAGLRSDEQPYCGAYHSNAAVYSITPVAGGTLTVEVVSDADVAVFAFEGDACAAGAHQSACVTSGGAPPKDLPIRLPLSAEAGVARSVAINAAEHISAYYRVTFTLGDAICGDGARNAGEACDFGYENAPSGCGPDCQILGGSPGSDVCPGVGEPGQVLPDSLYSAANVPELDGFTTGANDDYPSLAKNGAPDRVYELHPTQSGKLEVKATANFDIVLSVYLEACDPGDGALDGLVGVADSDQASADEVLTVDVIALSDYYLVVDGYDASSFGHYALELSLTAAP